MSKIVMGKNIIIEDVVKVARYKAEVNFSDEFIKRVSECRKFVEKASDEEKIMYGTTTGLGDNCNKFILKDDRERVQRNAILSHACSVGEPLDEEAVRAIMFVMIQHLGSGHTGIRLETLETIKDMLNKNITPFVPKHGSVGYLCLEAHIGLVLIGEGKAYYNGEILTGAEALTKANIKPVILSAKEGLSLINGTSSVTAITSLTLYDSIVTAKTCDISGAMSLEALKGTLMAMDERLMNVRPHIDQAKTAENIRRILSNSGILGRYKGHRVQDALSLRCIPQLHGAAKKTLNDAKITVEIELNSSVDNPQIFVDENGEETVIMGGNCDGSYVGIAADNLAIAITNLAKMSQQRSDRLVNGHVSELPAFLNSNPGFNNGLMIPQYTAAGLLGEMRVLAHPATVDNVSTSALQEDYVSMGYNAALKAYESTKLFRYIVAIELMFSAQAQDFFEDCDPAPATKAVRNLIREKVPFISEDVNMHPYIEHINSLIKGELIIKEVENMIGNIRF